MKKKYVLVVFAIGLLAVLFNTVRDVEAEVNNGEYSLDYLLKNYNVITLGQKTNNYPDQLRNNYTIATKGNIQDINNIDGAILVQGDYTSNNNATFGSQAGSVQSYIKGNKGSNVTTTSTLTTESNYVDFAKMYVQIANDQQQLLNNASKNILGPNIEVTSPGIYTINNAAINENERNGNSSNSIYSGNNRIIIKNYNKNDLYVFNMYDEYPGLGYNIVIMDNSSATTTTIGDLVNNGTYTGNIIFNLPKAKVVYAYVTGGNIIAPKADIIMQTSNYYGAIISNSIIQQYNSVNIKKGNYTLNKSIVNAENNSYIDENKDYNDDYYIGSYSLSELLQNYSLVTFGKKNLESKTKLSQNGQRSGSVRLFHAAGPVLINGDLYGEISEVPTGNTYQSFKSLRLDLESNTETNSYISGNASATIRNGNGSSYNTSLAYVQNWDNVLQSNKYYYNRKNLLIVGNNNNNYYYNGFLSDNYINFNRLYDKVTTQQTNIEEGTKLKSGEDGTVHIPIGGNYTIDDISNVNEIIFDNFDDNKDKLTIVTVKNSGDINFPLVSRDTGSYKGIVTNDYYNKTEVTHPYEINNLVTDSYHGNIVWNIPNATYIKLKENAPFAGHLVAPKADVETPELHFSGCFIVNSLYAEGNTEAHFYPLTVQPDCDCNEYDNLSSTMKMKFSSFRLNSLLGGDSTTVEKTILGDETQYNNDIATLKHVENHCPSNQKNNATSNPIVAIINNPLTFRNIGVVTLVLLVTVGSLILTKTKKKDIK